MQPFQRAGGKSTHPRYLVLKLLAINALPASPRARWVAALTRKRRGTVSGPACIERRRLHHTRLYHEVFDDAMKPGRTEACQRRRAKDDNAAGVRDARYSVVVTPPRKLCAQSEQRNDTATQWQRSKAHLQEVLARLWRVAHVQSAVCGASVRSTRTTKS